MAAAVGNSDVGAGGLENEIPRVRHGSSLVIARVLALAPDYLSNGELTKSCLPSDGKALLPKCYSE